MSNPTNTPVHVMNPQSPEGASRGYLLRAATEFRQWVESVAPDAVVFLCGGLALSLHGNPRQTNDADLAIDLSRTRRANGRPLDTNALKQIAAQSPHFSVGPKVYWILDAHTASPKYIQVDFVDAQLYWHPFDVAQMVVSAPTLPIPVMNLPTLLVGKMKSAIERSQANQTERILKQVNDIRDFFFALAKCTQQQLTLTAIHIQHLGATENAALVVIRAFFQLKAFLQQNRWLTAAAVPMDYQHQWLQLIVRSGLPESFITACC
ncbi:hypothetical protein A0H81_06953 [Grifola frondosa]|uniref:Uncharacterized protein n=1 Tax=Grifola frondosa TaxID=5627 RepID=A0A1C7M8F9_GRIFR|nr:hypothetical protein A0H81_06953 [Grifola frondosa]